MRGKRYGQRASTYLTTGVILNILNYGLSIKSENRTCGEPSVEDNYSHSQQPTFLLTRNKDCLLWSTLHTPRALHTRISHQGDNSDLLCSCIYFLILLYFLRSADGIVFSSYSSKTYINNRLIRVNKQRTTPPMSIFTP